MSQQLPVNVSWPMYMLFTFDGRLDRPRYWRWYGSLLAVTLVALMAGEPIVALATGSVPTWALNSKRCHDVGRSGWFQLLSLIPYVGWPMFLFLVAFQKGDDAWNEHGAPGYLLRAPSPEELKQGVSDAFLLPRAPARRTASNDSG